MRRPLHQQLASIVSWRAGAAGPERGRRRPQVLVDPLGMSIGGNRVSEVRVDRLDRAVFVVREFDGLLHIAQVVHAVRTLRVVIEQVRLAAHFHDRMMVGPAEHGHQDVAPCR